MHCEASRRWASRPLMTVMPEHPFVTGEARLTIARPIIGPPLMTLPASAGSPPAASISASTGVPIRVSRFLGSRTPLPVIVTTRSINGLCFCTAW